MPELPEVETTKRGIEPAIVGNTITELIVRNPKLRWPIPSSLQKIVNHTVVSVERRAKYLIINTSAGSALVHLGMSGSLRIIESREPPSAHDHVDLRFGTIALRFNDPRRFGCWLYVAPGEQPKLLDHLGPEPLSNSFNKDYFYEQAKKRSTSIKQFIMDNNVVVGVGNIYATEALFISGISPKRAASNISRKRLDSLHDAIVKVLEKAIGEGGTTLKDFVGGDGKPGYFKQHLNVYGRADKLCLNCSNTLKEIKQGGRSTVYCINCQR